MRVTFRLVAFVATLILVPALVMAGTDKGAKKAYEKGDFDTSVRVLVQKLRKKSNHQDNIRLMETVLPLSMNRHLRKAEDCKLERDWDCAYQEYTYLKEIADMVLTLPPVKKETKIDGKKRKVDHTFEVIRVNVELKEMRDSVVVAHYRQGLEDEEAGYYRDAVTSYKKVMEFNRKFRDVQERYAFCKDKAILRIAVMPFENISGKRRYGRIEIQLTEQIISNAMGENPEFLQFVTRDYLRKLTTEQGLQQTNQIDQTTATELGKKVGVHALVFGKIISVAEDYPPDVVEPGNDHAIYIEDNGSKRKTYVHWKKFTRTAAVTVRASFQIIDVETGTIMAAEQESGKGWNQYQWLTFKGDQRVLPKDISHLRYQSEQAVDPPDVLISSAISGIAHRLGVKLVEYFGI